MIYLIKNIYFHIDYGFILKKIFIHILAFLKKKIIYMDKQELKNKLRAKCNGMRDKRTNQPSVPLSDITQCLQSKEKKPNTQITKDIIALISKRKTKKECDDLCTQLSNEWGAQSKKFIFLSQMVHLHAKTLV